MPTKHEIDTVLYTQEQDPGTGEGFHNARPVLEVRLYLTIQTRYSHPDEDIRVKREAL